MFNFHTHIIDDVPCLLDCSPSTAKAFFVCSNPPKEREKHNTVVGLSVGLHPWDVAEDWREKVEEVSAAVRTDNVWTLGECGLDKVHGNAMPMQIEAFRAQIALSEAVGKPMIIHCVKAFDKLLALRHELIAQCRHKGHEPQPWVIHGFRGKPEQAKQLMTKGLLFSFGHHYHVETLRFAYAVAHAEICEATTSSRQTEHRINHPFFFETDDRHLSVRQIYEQGALHLGVDVAHLEHLCDPRHSLFRQTSP